VWEALIKYYGFDWLGMFFTFYSINAFKNKSLKGFIFGALACLSWMIFNIMAQSIAGVIANTAFIYLHYQGYKEWRKEKDVS